MLLLVTILEGQIKGWSKEEHLQEKPDELDVKKNAHGLALSFEETELYDCLRHSTIKYDRLYAESKATLELFQQRSVSIDREGEPLQN